MSTPKTPAARRCPTCHSRQPSMHPAVSGGGEVTMICPDSFHDGDPVTELARVRAAEDREERDFDARTILVRHGITPDPLRKFTLEQIEALAEVVKTWED